MSVFCQIVALNYSSTNQPYSFLFRGSQQFSLFVFKKNNSEEVALIIVSFTQWLNLTNGLPASSLFWQSLESRKRKDKQSVVYTLVYVIPNLILVHVFVFIGDIVYYFVFLMSHFWDLIKKTGKMNQGVLLLLLLLQLF